MKSLYRALGVVGALYLAACGGKECREGRVDLGRQALQHGASAKFYLCREDVRSTLVDEDGRKYDSMADYLAAQGAKMQKEVDQGTAQLRDQDLDLTQAPAEPCPEKEGKGKKKKGKK